MGSSRARQETVLLNFWLSSFQCSPNMAVCLSQGNGGRMERGHLSRGAWEGLGDRQLSEGHTSEELRKDHPVTLLTRKPAASLMRSRFEAFSLLGTSCFIWFGGTSVSKSRMKSNVGASEAGQGWSPESHQGPVQGLLLSFYNIFTRSLKRAPSGEEGNSERRGVPLPPCPPTLERNAPGSSAATPGGHSRSLSWGRGRRQISILARAGSFK